MTKWEWVRAAFALDPGIAHFAAMSLASHPKPVGWQIEMHRQALDRRPLEHVTAQFNVAEEAAFQAVSGYFGLDASLIALTHSTTMGLAQALGGIRVQPSGEILTSAGEHFTTTRTLALRQQRDGTSYRAFPLYVRASSATTREILDNVRAAIRPATRVLSLAWVYSSDGLKIPVRAVADLVAEVNRDRDDPASRLLFVIDGVHGFGVENTTFPALGCDLFVAGCHKWVFGPRGTGIVCATRDAWDQVDPIVTSFSAPTRGPGRVHSPGGVHAYEHTLALATAFSFLQTIGKGDLIARVRVLVDRLRVGLGTCGMNIETPASDDLSSGIVCFSKSGEPAATTVGRLAARNVLVTESGPDVIGTSHVRVSVAVFNSEADVDRLLNAL